MTRSAAYPAHPVMSIFSGSVLFASARRQNSIFFNDIQLLEIHHARTISNVRQVTLTQITEPDSDTVYCPYLNNPIRFRSPQFTDLEIRKS